MPRKLSKLSSAEVLYDDTYCTLGVDTLIIKRYFPTLKQKAIHVKAIRVVYYDTQKDAASYMKRKVWGMDNHQRIYWAADFSRCLSGEKHGRIDVIIDVEDGLKKGFSIADGDAFLTALRSTAPMSTIIVDSLNM